MQQRQKLLFIITIFQIIIYTGWFARTYGLIYTLLTVISSAFSCTVINCLMHLYLINFWIFVA